MNIGRWCASTALLALCLTVEARGDTQSGGIDSKLSSAAQGPKTDKENRGGPLTVVAADGTVLGTWFAAKTSQWGADFELQFIRDGFVWDILDVPGGARVQVMQA